VMLANPNVASVSIPVMSHATVSRPANCSNAAGNCNRSHARNCRDVAITCTAGTASASAQGQVTISTTLACNRADWMPTPRPKDQNRKGSVMYCARICGPLVLGQVSDGLARVPAALLCERQRPGRALLVPYYAGRLTTYAVLAAPAAGVLAMLCFGLGTVPSGIAVGVAGAATGRHFSRAVTVLAPAVLLRNAAGLIVLA